MAELQQPVLADSCVHRWRVGTPVGDACSGTCAVCGAVRLFTNERRPFGQPGRPRRILTPVQPAATLDAGVAAQLLAPAEPVRRDATLSE